MKDAETSINNATKATAESISLCKVLSCESIEISTNSKETSAADLYQELEVCLNNIAVNMQFYDAFSQRVHHVEELLELMKNEVCDKAGCADTLTPELTSQIAKIFSIKEEFVVMNTLFPEHEFYDNGKAIELF